MLIAQHDFFSNLFIFVCGALLVDGFALLQLIVFPTVLICMELYLWCVTYVFLVEIILVTYFTNTFSLKFGVCLLFSLEMRFHRLSVRYLYYFVL